MEPLVNRYKKAVVTNMGIKMEDCGGGGGAGGTKCTSFGGQGKHGFTLVL